MGWMKVLLAITALMLMNAITFLELASMSFQVGLIESTSWSLS